MKRKFYCEECGIEIDCTFTASSISGLEWVAYRETLCQPCWRRVSKGGDRCYSGSFPDRKSAWKHADFLSGRTRDWQSRVLPDEEGRWRGAV